MNRKLAHLEATHFLVSERVVPVRKIGSSEASFQKPLSLFSKSYYEILAATL
jgi:hypothetical protein